MLDVTRSARARSLCCVLGILGLVLLGGCHASDSDGGEKAGGEACSGDSECASGVCLTRHDDAGAAVSSTCKTVADGGTGPTGDASTAGDSSTTGDSSGADPLSAIENTFAGSWYYVKTSAFETHYFVFEKSRTGCYWHQQSGSSQREGEEKIQHWKLEPYSATSTGLYKVNVRRDNGTTSTFKYHEQSDVLVTPSGQHQFRRTTSASVQCK